MKPLKRWALGLVLVAALAAGAVTADHVTGINNIPVLLTNETGDHQFFPQLPFNASSISLSSGGWMQGDALNTEMLDGEDHPAYMPGTGMVRMLACFDDSSTDETDECNDATANDITLPATGSEVYEFAADNQFRHLHLNISTPAVADWEIEWQYWDGSNYVALGNVTDGTNHFQNSGAVRVSWDFPAAGEWVSDTLNSVEGYWVRAEVTVFTSATQAPLGQQAGYETGRWWSVINSIGMAEQEQKRLDLQLGTGDLRDFHWYVPHEDGFSIDDDATLEPGTDFEVRFAGYIDTTQDGSAHEIISKGSDFRIRRGVNTSDSIAVFRNGSGVLFGTGIVPSGYHEIVVRQEAGVGMELEIDGAVVASIGTATAINDNSDPWVFAEGTVVRAMEYMELDIGGNPALAYQFTDLPGLLLRNQVDPLSVNQVPNGAFGSNVNGWVELPSSELTFTSGHDAAEGRTAAGSLEIDVTASTAPGVARRDLSPRLSVDPGDRWTVSAWVKADHLNSAQAELIVQYLDSGGSGVGSRTLSTTDTSGDWVQLSTTNFEAPASADVLLVRLQIRVTEAGGTGQVWWDDVSAQFAQDNAFDTIAYYPTTPEGFVSQVLPLESTGATLPGAPSPGQFVPAIDELPNAEAGEHENTPTFLPLMFLDWAGDNLNVPYQAMLMTAAFVGTSLLGLIAYSAFRSAHVMYAVMVAGSVAAIFVGDGIWGWVVPITFAVTAVVYVVYKAVSK